MNVVVDEVAHAIFVKAHRQGGRQPKHIVLDPYRYDILVEQLMLMAREQRRTLQTRHGFILFLDVEVERA